MIKREGQNNYCRSPLLLCFSAVVNHYIILFQAASSSWDFIESSRGSSRSFLTVRYLDS